MSFNIKIAFLKQGIQKKAWNIFAVRWTVFSQEKAVSQRALAIKGELRPVISLSYLFFTVSFNSAIRSSSRLISLLVPFLWSVCQYTVFM